jgi:pectate lyase
LKEEIVLKRIFKNLIASVLSAAIMFSAMSVGVSADTLSVTKSGGWYEYAFAAWSGADNVTVEYKEKADDDSAYTAVDTELIGDGRVDIPGLKGDTEYSIKITSDSASAVTTVKTMSYNRDGYAHYKKSDGVGAYNNDGTLKDNADVIYVTNENKNTVAYGGYTGIGNILKNAKKLSKPLAVRFIGTVDTQTRDADGTKTTDKNNGVVAINGLTDTASSSDSYFNMCDITDGKNITLEGIGTDAHIEKWGFTLKGASSFEIRNLNFSDYPEDAVGMEKGSAYSQNVWVHNNNFEPGYNAYDLTKEKDKGDGDGSTDIKYSYYVTVSDNYYHACHKTSLIGGGSSHIQDYITVSRNFFDETFERTPRVRNAHVHVYNNYYKSVTGYGIGASYNSRIFSEANYFENANVPITMGPVGSDKYSGTVKSYADVFDNCYSNANPDSSKTGTSYVEASSRDEVMNIPNQVSGGNAYDNFDTDSSKFYYGDYTVLSAEAARTKVSTYSGVLKEDSGYNEGSADVNTDTTTETTTESTTEATTVTTVTDESSTETTTEVYTETTTETTTNYTIICGDVDNSGKLTANDCAEILIKTLDNSYKMPIELAYPDKAAWVADVNSDGIYTADDAAWILSKVLNNSIELPLSK